MKEYIDCPRCAGDDEHAFDVDWHVYDRREIEINYIYGFHLCKSYQDQADEAYDAIQKILETREPSDPYTGDGEKYDKFDYDVLTKNYPN